MDILIPDHFIKKLIIHTICNVTGEIEKNTEPPNTIKLNTRDREQIFSRLEATLDIQTGILASANQSFSIDTLTLLLHTKLTNNLKEF